MITVRLLGGARKSFPAGSVTLDCSETTVSDLLGMLSRCKPPDTPDLDVRNVLVAINGADSSVGGGRSAAIRDGDQVDIIPIIHGGAHVHRLYIGETRIAVLCVPGGEADPDRLRRRFGARIQSISSEYILNMSYLRRILEVSIEAERRGTMLTARIETDILLRLAGTTQISEAIRRVGAKTGPGDGAVVVALGDDHDLEAICDALSGVSLPLPGQDGSTPGCYEGVPVPPGRSLEEMLAERAAVL